MPFLGREYHLRGTARVRRSRWRTTRRADDVGGRWASVRVFLANADRGNKPRKNRRHSRSESARVQGFQPGAAGQGKAGSRLRGPGHARGVGMVEGSGRGRRRTAEWMCAVQIQGTCANVTGKCKSVRLAAGRAGQGKAGSRRRRPGLARGVGMAEGSGWGREDGTPNGCVREKNRGMCGPKLTRGRTPRGGGESAAASGGRRRVGGGGTRRRE